MFVLKAFFKQNKLIITSQSLVICSYISQNVHIHFGINTAQHRNKFQIKNTKGTSMKIKQVIICGLFLGSLTGAIAGILSKKINYYRCLNFYERQVLGYISDLPPDEQEPAILRRICYIETNQVYPNRLPAQDMDDVLLEEFKAGKFFEQHCNDSLGELIAIVGNNSEKPPASLIAAWLIRKKIDDHCAIFADDMKFNMWYFHKSYDMIFNLIKTAKGSGTLNANNARDRLNALSTALGAGHERDYLDYLSEMLSLLPLIIIAPVSP